MEKAPHVMNEQPGSLLVVDDNKTNLDMLSRRLRRNGYAVTLAASGEAARTLIREQSFDLVVLDIMMPGMSGLEVLKWLRAGSEYSNIAVIMATARDDNKDIVEALDLGADDYVTKPIDFPVLLARIKTQLSRKREMDRLQNAHQALQQHVDARTAKLQEAIDSLQSEVSYRGKREKQPERKYVTVLFSDLCGYTAISERLDPEEVKEIMNRVLKAASEAVRKHGGILEKFLGDGILAVFGLAKTCEDDPVRAMKAAMEIHERVDALNDSFLRRRLGQTLQMHSGINTGLVITGPRDVDSGTESILGNTVNLAARLTGLAEAGEILVGSETYRQTQGYFHFELRDPAPVKGYREPVGAYKLVAGREVPRTIHRLTGLASDLVGRRGELHRMQQAVAGVHAGRGAVLLVHGPTGIGKSRLIEEFRKNLVGEPVRWFFGNAYPFTQAEPYAVFADFLRRLCQIEENDPTGTVRAKLEKQIELLKAGKDIAPCIGRLFTLEYPAVQGMSPSYWRSEFADSIRRIIAALFRRAPSIVCLENIHWADNASRDLLRLLITDAISGGTVIYSYTTPFNILGHQRHELQENQNCHEIELDALSPAEMQAMTKSLLNAEQLPIELTGYVANSIGGNPFYLEEIINSLVESNALVHAGDEWRLNRPIRSSDIPSTIHGVIAARLDRLDSISKRVLQEAAVIGPVFSREILERITEHKVNLDECLARLLDSDLIKVESLPQHGEYGFKQALVHEVVYSTLLLSERPGLHRLVAHEIEAQYSDRLPEYYETLLHHYRLGEVGDKTVEYLVLAAEKSLDRYSVEEAHRYFEEAYRILIRGTEASGRIQCAVIDLLAKWAIAHFYRGDFKSLAKLCGDHEQMAVTLDDKKRLGMFYVWFGKALYYQDQARIAHEYLDKALRIGEQQNSAQVVGHACSSLVFTCKQMGMLDQAAVFGERAAEVYRHSGSDPISYTRSLVGLGDVYYYAGRIRKIRAIGEALFAYARDVPGGGQATTSGHVCVGLAHLCSGDFRAAVEAFESAVEDSMSPFFAQWPKLWLGYSYILNDQIQDAEDVLKKLLDFSRQSGGISLERLAEGLMAVVLCRRENLTEGLALLNQAIDRWASQGARIFVVHYLGLMGKIYLNIVQQAQAGGMSMLGKDLKYVFKFLPFADRNAAMYLQRVIDDSIDLGARGLLGPAYLDLARLHRLKGNRERASINLSAAIREFERCEAEQYLEQAEKEKGALARS